MTKRRKLTLSGVVAVLAALVVTVFSATPASAHGAMMQPGSRTFLCWKDGLTSTGEVSPKNPACAAAVAQSGANSLYNWFSVLRSDGAGRTRGFIPDGKLCSGGNPNFAGFDGTGTDWPVTHLTSGATLNFRYNKWAAHPGSFYLYVTKDGWNPAAPLTWSEIEDQPFLVADHPPDTGPVGSVDGYYYWSGKLPSNKTGRHIIYSVWTRSDSTETFYGCSDVVFDGGNGEVTGIGQTSPPGTGGPCTATYRTTGNWSGGYQGQVTITNPGTAALAGWTVTWTLPDGETINSVWNGNWMQHGSLAMVSNTSWNAQVAPGGSASFGFTANYSGAPPTPSLSCTSP